MGPDIPHFRAGGRGCQDIGNILQGDGSDGPPVWIGDVGHDPMHRQDSGGIDGNYRAISLFSSW